MAQRKVPVIRITETFMLRRIDPKMIISKYFKGDYSDRDLPEQKIKSNLATFKVGKEVGSNESFEVYKFKDKNNNNLTVYTTNHALYSFVSQTGKDPVNMKDEKPILRCKYCKRCNLKAPIGLPVAMEYIKSELETKTDKGVSRVKPKEPSKQVGKLIERTIERTIDKMEQELIFHVIDCYCDFRCAFSYLKRRTGESRLYRGPFYSNCEQLLYCMYYRVYPERKDEKILEKPDWELLRENGGPLSSEEFDGECAEFYMIPSLAMLSAKKQYFKINNGLC